MKNVCVIGGGPAGMMAAYAAAQNGHRVTLIEKNEKLGKKLYITGKGRCNITNAADIADFFDQVVTHSSFLYSAFYTLTNTALLDLLASFGLETKTERGGRVFPVSDKASDVTRALITALERSGVLVRLNTQVESVAVDSGFVSGIVVDGQIISFDSVIVATGGVSYPGTGSTGDGYRFAKETGHRVAGPQATLVGLDTIEDTSTMAGLTLKNVALTLRCGGRDVYSQQGELLFTHTGLSGPLALSASAYMDEENALALVDLKPALDEKTLDRRLVRDLAERSNQTILNALAGLLPAKLIAHVVASAGIAPDRKAHSVTKQERAVLYKTLKALPFQISGKRPVREAVVTRGGVDVKQIDPTTMQSRLVNGLFFAGEVIDVDALTGGYNLQIAFSTGFLAGQSC